MQKTASTFLITIITFLTALLLAGCASAARTPVVVEIATATSNPTNTPKLTATTTATPQPTSSPTLTLTPNPTPTPTSQTSTSHQAFVGGGYDWDYYEGESDFASRKIEEMFCITYSAVLCETWWNWLPGMVYQK
jgi:hypothetical protein